MFIAYLTFLCQLDSSTLTLWIDAVSIYGVSGWFLLIPCCYFCFVFFFLFFVFFGGGGGGCCCLFVFCLFVFVYFCKISELNVNSVDPDQKLRYEASDLGLRCLLMSFYWDARHKWV